MAQNSNQFCLEFNFSPNFEPSQFFRAKKSEPLRQKDTWSIFRRENKRKMNGSNFEPSRFQMQSLSCVMDVLRWLFEPSHHTPVFNQLIIQFNRGQKPSNTLTLIPELLMGCPPICLTIWLYTFVYYWKNDRMVSKPEYRILNQIV